jgi:hypothetical protein
MSTLFLMFDVEAGRFSGASLKGKFFHGIAEVHLGAGRVSVLDADGRDLLADPAKALTSVPDDTLQAIAQALGYEHQSAGADQPAGGSDAQDPGDRA